MPLCRPIPPAIISVLDFMFEWRVFSLFVKNCSKSWSNNEKGQPRATKALRMISCLVKIFILDGFTNPKSGKLRSLFLVGGLMGKLWLGDHWRNKNFTGTCSLSPGILDAIGFEKFCHFVHAILLGELHGGIAGKCTEGGFRRVDLYKPRFMML